MIIRVKKILLYGMKKDLDQFFPKAQEMGVLEFISSTSAKLDDLPPNIEELVHAIQILQRLPRALEQETSSDMDILASRMVSIRANIDKGRMEESALLHEIDRVEPFGDFSLDDFDYLQKEGKRFFQFFCVSKSQAKKAAEFEELIYVGENNDFDYFVSINKEWKQYPDFTEITFDKPVGMLWERLHIVQKEIQELEIEIKGYPKYFEAFREEIVKRYNEYALQVSKDGVVFPIEEKSFFAIQAWVPLNYMSKLEKSLENLSISYSEVALDENEKEPTYMENKGFARVGEDLVAIYDTPDATDKDPSFLVMFFFSLFFAMITSDAGYGFLYLLLGFFLQKKYSVLTHIFVRSRDMIPRVIKLTYVLAISCILWGGLTGSFFGLSIGPNSLLGKMTVINYVAKKKADYHLRLKDDVYQTWVKKYPELERATSGDDFLEIAKQGKKFEALSTFKNNILLEFALLVGALHVSLGALRNVRKNIANVGWVLFIIGGFLFFPKIVQATSFFVYMDWISPSDASGHGIQLIYGGMALALVLAIIQKGWAGLHEPMSVIQIFADILSYLRLFALGLAASIMAETFNELGSSIPFAAGFVVILLGHMINIVMGIMAGFIHGLRLNFLEWYHYCFQGNGKRLNPLYLIK
ncbi:MAG: V-type ATPase 116kDa subunit family protein [Chlamydiota bacterium]